MTVSELLIAIEGTTLYVHNSLYLKSSDINGCVYKWLEKTKDIATRKELFIELDPEESELDLGNKTVINSVEVFPAQ